MPDLLLIGVGMMGRPYLEAARRLGVRVHAVENAQRAGALAGQVDGLTMTRGDSDECWAEAAASAATSRRPDGVIAFSEAQVTAAALVADQFGLPGPSLRAAAISRNKGLQRGRFAAAGIRQPGYLVVPEAEAATAWASTRYPVVLKALSQAGSVGVELLEGPADLAGAVARRGGEGPLLVETAVTGPEYSWDALVHEGTVWFANVTEKETTGPPEFVETGHRTAAHLTPEVAAAVGELGRSVLAALGMRSGVVHLEFRLAPAGPTLIEVAVRTPGDFLMDLLNLTYGVDWFEIVVRLALGMPLPEPPSGRIAWAAAHFPLAEPGRVTAIEGLEEVRAHPAVNRAGVLAHVGDVLEPVVNSLQRRAFVLLASEDQGELEEGLAFARRTLAIRTEPLVLTPAGSA